MNAILMCCHTLSYIAFRRKRQDAMLYSPFFFRHFCVQGSRSILRGACRGRVASLVGGNKGRSYTKAGRNNT